MYNQYFGLKNTPFSMSPDPRLLFLPPQHREALAGLVYAVLNRKGFVVLVGDAGTGKTTLLTKVLRSLPAGRIRASLVPNPTLTPSEFIELVLMEFGLADIPPSKAQRLTAFARVLLRNHSEGRASVLIIDEAHKLSHEVLEEVRLLSNFWHGDQNLLQIVLSGQNELGDVLNHNDMRQLKQRIAVRVNLTPLERADVDPYIRYRWTHSGGMALPFSAAAIDAIAAVSQGIPRLINAVCDNALTTAFGQGIRRVEESHILAVAKDLDLNLPIKTPPAPIAPQPAQMAAPLPSIAPIRTVGSQREAPRRSFFARWRRNEQVSLKLNTL
jgi:general secretion pathway protein A